MHEKPNQERETWNCLNSAEVKRSSVSPIEKRSYSFLGVSDALMKLSLPNLLWRRSK